MTDQLINFYNRLAKGGVGLIILGYGHVQENGRVILFSIKTSSNDKSDSYFLW